MSTLDTLYRCTKKDMIQAGLNGADAFQDDPMWAAVLEGETDEKLAICLEISFRHCLKYGAVYSPDQSLEGLIAVVPGKFCDMSMWRMIMAGSFPLMGKMGTPLGKKMELYFDPLIKDQKENMRGRNYIYIFLLGVKKESQGKGIGGKLLRAIIAECDQKGQAIYLETETEENVQIYEHFGFKTVKKTALPEINCPMWEMVREPQ